MASTAAETEGFIQSARTAPGVGATANSFRAAQSSETQRMHRAIKGILAGVFLAAAGAGGIIAMSLIYHETAVPAFKYGIVFDAGSSGTRLYLYRWSSNKVESTGLVSQIYNCQVKQGSQSRSLSSFSATPEAAGPSLVACLEKAKAMIPATQQSSTHVYLAATAGLRVLNYTEPVAVSQILSSVRLTLRESGLSIDDEQQQVRILSGVEEGVAGWVAVNYITGKLGHRASGVLNLTAENQPADTFGALDLGGASTQITFVDTAIGTPLNYSTDLVLLADKYKLYSYSFMCYGMNEASKLYQAKLVQKANNIRNLTTDIQNPCAPIGFSINMTSRELFSSHCSLSQKPPISLNYTFYGTGNESECEVGVRELFDFTSCTFSNCSFNGIYMPPIASVDFAAFSGYYYVALDLNLVGINNTSGHLTRPNFARNTQELCSKEWNDVKNLKVFAPQKLCFSAHYVNTLLTNGYKMSDDAWRRVRFTKSANGTDFNWALGYMLNLTNVIESTPDPVYYVTILSYALVITAVSILFLIGVVCSIHSCKRAKTSGRLLISHEKNSVSTVELV